MKLVPCIAGLGLTFCASAQLVPQDALALPTRSNGAPSNSNGGDLHVDSSRVVLAVGSIDAGFNGEGIVRVFTIRPGSVASWKDVHSPMPTANGQFGWNIEITDQEMFISERSTGKVHVFERTNTGPIHTQTIALNAFMPSSLVAHGDRLFIGDPFDSNYPGRVHVLERLSSGWSVTRVIEPPFPASQQNFGASLRVIGNQLAVAEGVSPVSSCTGRVWLYDLHDLGANPAQLPAPIGASGCSLFGTGIFADGSTLIVRARDDSGASSQAGAAFFYERNSTGAWQQALKLGPPNNESNWEWGVSSVRDGVAIVSGDRHDAPRILQVARRTGSSWASQETVALPVGSINRPWGNQVVDGTAFLPYFSPNGSAVAVVALDADCDADGLSDALELRLDPSQDCNGDGIPDACEAQAGCPTDLDDDGTTDGRDLGVLVSTWESTGPSLEADVNGDGNVDCVDLAVMLAAWGACD